MIELDNIEILNYQDKLFNTETKEHVENVSVMTVFVAGFFDFTDEELHNIGLMARFHDIGKVRIPLEILERNGPLTEQEWILVKQHPMFGVEIMKDFGFSESDTAMIYQHHERCNGGGYPFGLGADEITLESKILGAVDVMDALLSDRAYKKGWEVERVRKFFEENEEGFCQNVVDVLLENFDELINLRTIWRI